MPRTTRRGSKPALEIDVVEELKQVPATAAGPGCAPADYPGVDLVAAHAYHLRLVRATESLQKKLGREATLQFVRKHLRTLNRRINPRS